MDYLKASDVFVLPTREDIWGLVINEAMACGLPVVTTNKCNAGLQLVKDGVNGYIVDVDDPDSLADSLNKILAVTDDSMQKAALDTIREYTIESMVDRHIEILNSNIKNTIKSGGV